MIRSLKKIKKFGIFDNWESSNVIFEKFNLFYGWNGVGKSTLSKVLQDLVAKDSRYSDGDYVFYVGDDKIGRNEGKGRLDIAVFNQDFVKKNLDFDLNKAEDILYISETKIKEKKHYEELKLQLENSEKDTKKLISDFNHLEEQLSKSLTRIAKNIKNSFGLIKTSNKRLLNYDKSKLKETLIKHKHEIGEKSVLQNEDVEKLRISTQSLILPVIPEFEPCLDSESFNSFLNSVEEVLARNVISLQIESLKKRPDLNNWAFEGLNLHRHYNLSECGLCGGQILPDRLSDLEQHFNEGYTKLIKELGDLINVSKKYKESLVMGLPDANIFYDESRDGVLNLFVEIHRLIASIFDKILSCLSRKLEKPFESFFCDISNESLLFSQYLDAVSRLNCCVQNHNTKTANFDSVVSADNLKLELHFISKEEDALNIYSMISGIEESRGTLESAQQIYKSLSEEVNKAHIALIDSALGADVFNNKLKCFLGRSDLKLVSNLNDGGYFLTRNGDLEKAINLSEGEKTAIAFIFFDIKIRENGNDISNKIIVLDDPISSFDSQNLHNTYSFIRSNYEECRQLFVLTHNFEFFRLVRDWFKKKNKKEEVNAMFYYLRASKGVPRSSEIIPLSTTLLEYDSEYHLLFSKLLKFNGCKEFDFETSYFIGNCSRKILEAFLTFKFPSHKGDFRSLMGKVCLKDEETLNRVYTFINRYSHYKTLEVFASNSDNTFSEAEGIVELVLNLIEKSDPIHFKEMMKVVK